MMHGQKTWK